MGSDQFCMARHKVRRAENKERGKTFLDLEGMEEEVKVKYRKNEKKVLELHEGYSESQGIRRAE